MAFVSLIVVANIVFSFSASLSLLLFSLKLSFELHVSKCLTCQFTALPNIGSITVYKINGSVISSVKLGLEIHALHFHYKTVNSDCDVIMNHLPKVGIDAERKNLHIALD